jgi:NADH dehydrogenase FAD-containing subunit
MADDTISAATKSPSSGGSARRDESRLDLRLRAQNNTTRVVIIGGGYAGSKAAQKISKEFPTYEVVLIDSKDYFENTIAVLTCLTHVDIASSVSAAMKIVIRHDHYLGGNVRVIKELVKEVTPTKVILATETIYYDHLILACGTSYRSSIKAPNLTSDFRVQALSKDAADLAAVDSVLVVGGGLVGVELAAEIVHKYPNKQITLATAGDRLLARMKPNVSAAALKWLTSRGVKVAFNERVTQSTRDPTVFKFPTSGERVTPGKAYWCTGFVPNSNLLVKHFAGSLSDSGFVKVNSYLQMQGAENQNVWVVGDIADLSEEKMAERAWAHASYVVKCLKTLRKGQPLTKAYKSPKKPPLMVISLGPDTSLLCTNRKLTTQGSVAASVKRWSFRTMMLKQVKQNGAFSPRLPDLETRLALDSAQFTSSGSNKKIALIGHCNRIVTDLATLLSQLGTEVHILTSADVDKNTADQLAEKSPALIKSHNANPKIANSILTPLRGLGTVVFPYAMAAQDPVDLLQPYLEHLATLTKEGSLKRFIVVHPGYYLDRAPKKSILGNRMRELEELVRNIDPKLKVTIVRYAPIFEALRMTSGSVVESKVVKFPLPQKGLPLIAAEDIRDSVVKILTSTDDQHDNQVYSICGDTRITPNDVCQAIQSVSGHPITFEEIPASQLNSALTRLSSSKMAPMYIDWWAHSKHLTKQTEDLDTILGLPSISLADWVQLNSHFFV